MSIKTTQCLILLCDDCQDGYDDEQGPWHFPHMDALHEYAHGWLIDGYAHGWAVCLQCQLKRICAAEGHVWGPWLAIGFRPGRWRFCERELEGYKCAANEEQGGEGQ